jgi:HNH endonuclease
MAKEYFSADKLREAMDYDPETGLFYWKSGKPVSLHTQTRGYKQIKIFDHLCMAHRLAWLWVYGYWPTNVIDHINGKTDDNRLENLRDVTHTENLRNRTKVNKNSISGYPGVRPSANGKKWRAYVVTNGKSHYYGTHEDPELAYRIARAIKRMHYAGIPIS